MHTPIAFAEKRTEAESSFEEEDTTQPRSTHVTSDRVSEGSQQAKTIYDECLDQGFMSDVQLTDLNLADKETTPLSSLPVKYTCQYCGKTYAEDQRQYYTRHIKQKRCMGTSVSALSTS